MISRRQRYHHPRRPTTALCEPRDQAVPSEVTCIILLVRDVQGFLRLDASVGGWIAPGVLIASHAGRAESETLPIPQVTPGSSPYIQCMIARYAHSTPCSDRPSRRAAAVAASSLVTRNSPGRALPRVSCGHRCIAAMPYQVTSRPPAGVGLPRSTRQPALLPHSVTERAALQCRQTFPGRYQTGRSSMVRTTVFITHNS